MLLSFASNSVLVYSVGHSYPLLQTHFPEDDWSVGVTPLCDRSLPLRVGYRFL